MSHMSPHDMIEEISKFMEKWYPQNIAPLVVKRQLKMTGALEEKLNEKDILILLSRIEKVVLPSFMSMDEAREKIIELKKNLGLRF